MSPYFLCFFFFNDTATTEIYTLSYTTLFRSPLPDVGGADPLALVVDVGRVRAGRHADDRRGDGVGEDRKSTRLNSSHSQISYAVFCLKKKKKKEILYYLYVAAG